MKNAISMLVLGLMVGCGAGAVGSGEQDDASIDGLSTRTPALVTVRADTRRCAAPSCGGYYLQAVGSKSSTYVFRFDFAQAGLSDADVAKVQQAPAEELLLRGKLGAKGSDGSRSFIVLDAYRGMPGIQAQGGASLYTVSGAPKNCVRAPCDQFVAHPVSGSGDMGVSSVSVASASASFVDQSWLAARVQAGTAIVAAAVVDGQAFSGGAEKVLDASQVYLHLPEAAGPCPMMRVVSCLNGEQMVYTRDANRCMVNAGCAAPSGICAQMAPTCPAGYTRTAWNQAGSACPSYACDPSWVVE